MQHPLDDLESDEGNEGFEAQTPMVEQVISQVIQYSKEVKNQRPTDFEPRYICVDGILKYTRSYSRK